jgi:hypothetical protein
VIDEIHLEKGKLFVLDYTLSAGGRNSDPMACERLHILDPVNGEKKLRFRVGDQGRFVGVHGDSVCVARYNDVGYFSVTNGNLFSVYSRETLPGLFKELSSGVDNYMWGDGRNIMEINALDGTNWNLYTKTGTIYSADKKPKTDSRPPYVPTYKLSIHEREIRIDDGPGANVYLELDGVNENQHKLFIKNEHDSILNEDLFFLDGYPFGINLKDSCFYVLHFETLKKEKFLISCISLDGKRKLWEIKQSDFVADYKFPDPIVPCVEADAENGKIYFNIGTEIFAVTMKDGKLLWRTKL